MPPSSDDQTFQTLLARRSGSGGGDDGAAARGGGGTAARAAVRVALAGVLWPAFARAGAAGAAWWLLGGVQLAVAGEIEVMTADLVGVRRRRGETRSLEELPGERPDWICEIVTSTAAEVPELLARWARLRVPHAWIVDVPARTVTTFRWTSPQYSPQLVLGPGATARLDPFAQITIAADDLFAVAEAP